VGIGVLDVFGVFICSDLANRGEKRKRRDHLGLELSGFRFIGRAADLFSLFDLGSTPRAQPY